MYAGNQSATGNQTDGAAAQSGNVMIVQASNAISQPAVNATTSPFEDISAENQIVSQFQITRVLSPR